MKSLTKKLLSMALAVMMVFSIIPMGIVNASAADYVARTTKPSTSNKYYYADNLFYKIDCGIPNCTAYAWGRAYELLGKKPSLPTGNAGTWYGENKRTNNYKYGSKPQLGAIVCWGNSGAGHVAVVEGINTNGTIDISESNWSGRTHPERAFRYRRGINPYTYTGTLQGYIYVLDGQTTLPPETGDDGNTGNGNGTGHVTVGATKVTGTYKATDSVYLRTNYGTNGTKTLLLIPTGAQVNITETKHNWGKCTYNGKTGWTCLDYYALVQVPTPGTPTLIINATNVAQKSNVTLSWSPVSNATGYKVKITGAENKEIDVGNTTNKPITLNNAGTYTFSVMAYNIKNKSGWSSAKSCVSHAPSTVTVTDHEGVVKERLSVDYGKSVTLNAPSRKGYTFQGWSGSTYNITKDTTLTPIYKINTYNVKFWGLNNQQLGKTQKVNYGDDATPPADTGAPENYAFVDWSSEAYKDVFTDANDKTINIYAIYEWANQNIPLTCEITEAYRDSDGYHVLYNIKNNVSDAQTGRAIISLKTAEGKLIYTTESKTFSLAGNSSKNNIDEFFECEETASVIEIVIVDSYMTGTPISKNVTSTIQYGLGWSNWTEKKPEAGVEYETRNLYRYKDKEFTTANSKTLDGWTYNGVASTSQSSGNSWNAVSAVNTDHHVRNVSTKSELYGYNKKTQYYYTRYRGVSGSSYRFGPWAGTWSGIYCGTLQTKGWQDGALPNWGSGTGGGTTFQKYGSSSDPWYNQQTRQVDNTSSPIYKTKYYYTDTYYTYNFWRWKNWSDWSANAVSATDTRAVETKLQYRTNNGTEDTSGTTLPPKKYYVGTDFADKQVVLFVYKFDAASDYTDEFVGQTKVDANGYCTFSNIKLREEPSIQTGDFTFALGIEGTTNTFVVDKLEAPKPTYTVNFYDWDGTVIETQTVKEGESAILPSFTPAKEGYNFTGWSESLTNIRQDTDIFANMEKRTYQVIFVDWENQFIEVRSFEHGDVLTPPENAEVEGHTFSGWDKVKEGKTVVTENMVVAAEYEKDTYTVKFYDYDGKVIETQEVEFGEAALPPEDVASNDGKQFAGWFNPEDYERVDSDIAIYPSYYFEETADIPTANYENGVYDEAIKVTLTSTDENAVIYYYINGDESAEKIYTGPITIDKSAYITYYATSIGKNDSGSDVRYYCINNSTTPSKWMLYSELPEDVKTSTFDYNVENATGYKYKDTVTTSSVAQAESYLADGWTYASQTYSSYTAWQDEKIATNNSLIGFEVSTQQVEDATVTRYEYRHYKYVDSNGVVQYSPTAVDGYSCEYETVVVDNKLSIAGFLDDAVATSYYEYNGAKWFTQKKVAGEKTQYRSRYKINTYYKWGEWTTTAPTSAETREHQSDTVYRYSNRDYYIVNVYDDVQLYTFFVEGGKTIAKSQLPTLDGYEMEGLYLDGSFEQKFNMSTPITQSTELFVKFNPKKFTVIFQMADGTELDTQTVNYMEAAVSPDTDSVPGYVFSKWDKEFDCITENTIVTGRYYRESEYARVSLDKTVMDMYQGNANQLGYTITPAALSGEAVEWSSSNPKVAEVDDKGVVTALLPGEAEITVTVLKTRETATCKIVVNEDCANYIVLTTNSTLNNDSLGYLRRIGFNTSVKSASENFRNDNLLFYNLSGAQLGANDVVGTGTVIKLMKGAEVLDSETIIVTGDMTGDGILNNRDVAMANRYLVSKVSPQECQILALDLNGDGYINNKDAAMAARYLVGKDAII